MGIGTGTGMGTKFPFPWTALMRRFINEQEPQNELNQQSAAQVEHHYVSQAQDHGPNFEKRRVRTPAAIVPPRRTTNEPALPSNATHQQSLTMKGGFVTEKSSKDVIAGNNTGSVAERPKAAVVSRRSREALEIREDGDAEFGIIDDDAHKSKSPTPVSREQPSGAPGTSKPGDKGKKDELQVDEGYSRRRREKEKESRRDKSRSRSRDSFVASPKKSKGKGKSKSKSKSRSRSKSPLITTKSKHKSRSRSQSRSRSVSRSPSPPVKSKSKEKGGRKPQKKVPKSRRMEEQREKTAAAVAAAAASVVAKRKSLELPTASEDHQQMLDSMDFSEKIKSGNKRESHLTLDQKAGSSSVIVSALSPHSAKTDSSQKVTAPDSSAVTGKSQSFVDKGGGPGFVQNRIMTDAVTMTNNVHSTEDSKNTMIHDKYYESQFQEEDGDSGIGIFSTSRRNKMLEKKSVFTIAYDEMASQKVLRPDTAMRPGTMEAL